MSKERFLGFIDVPPESGSERARAQVCAALQLSDQNYDQCVRAWNAIQDFDRRKDIARIVVRTLDDAAGVFARAAGEEFMRGAEMDSFRAFMLDLSAALANVGASFFMFGEHHKTACKREFGRDSKELAIIERLIDSSDYFHLLRAIRHHCVHVCLPKIEGGYTARVGARPALDVHVARAPLVNQKKASEAEALCRFPEQIDLQLAISGFRDDFDALFQEVCDLYAAAVEPAAAFLMEGLSKFECPATAIPIIGERLPSTTEPTVHQFKYMQIDTQTIAAILQKG